MKLIQKSKDTGRNNSQNRNEKKVEKTTNIGKNNSQDKSKTV